MFEQLQEVNQTLLVFFNNLLDYNFIKLIVPYIADLPIFFLPIFLLSFWIYYSIKKENIKKHKLLFILYATILGLIISLIIQQFVDIDRPESYIKNAENLILNHVPDASFPSDHATVSIAFMTSLFLFGYKKIFYCFISFIILMLISRIITALHWPFDILAGILVGIFSAFIIFKFRKNKYLVLLNNFIIKVMGLIKL